MHEAEEDDSKRLSLFNSLKESVKNKIVNPVQSEQSLSKTCRSNLSHNKE